MTNPEFDRLKHMYDDQRKELEYRRNRQNEAFKFGSGAFTVVIGAALFVSRDNSPPIFGSYCAALMFSIVLAIAAFFSSKWQLKQRRLAARNQERLVEIQKALGFFEGPAAYPGEWTDWGKRHVTMVEHLKQPGKLWVTLGLCALSIASVWIVAYSDVAKMPNGASQAEMIGTHTATSSVSNRPAKQHATQQ